MTEEPKAVVGGSNFDIVELMVACAMSDRKTRTAKQIAERISALSSDKLSITPAQITWQAHNTYIIRQNRVWGPNPHGKGFCYHYVIGEAEVGKWAQPVIDRWIDVLPDVFRVLLNTVGIRDEESRQ